MLHFSQPTFEMLIANSLAALENSGELLMIPANHHQNPIATLISPGSIGDFLAEYEHENKSISDIMLYLDGFTSALSEQTPMFTPPDKLHQVHTTKTSKKIKSGGEPMEKFRPAPLITKEFCTSKITAESREELRRSKNREYQRRFREKKIRLELERLSKLSNSKFF